MFCEYDNIGIHYSLNTFRYSLIGNSLSKSSLISWYEKKGQAAKRKRLRGIEEDFATLRSLAAVFFTFYINLVADDEKFAL